MTAADHCQCTGCVDCEPWEVSGEHSEVSGELQHNQHCRRTIVHFTDNRCNECHEEELVSDMMGGVTQAISGEHPASPL